MFARVALDSLCVSSGTSTGMHSGEDRERSLSFPTEAHNVPRHSSMQSTHSVAYPTAEMYHSGDPLSSAPTTHLSRISSSGS